MNFIFNLIWFLTILAHSVYGWFEDCNYDIQLNQTIYIASPNYPRNYPPGSSCLYHIIAPLDHEINIECTIKLEKAPNSSTCGTELFYISTDGDRQLRGSEYVCGTGYIQRKSVFNKLTIAYTSSSSIYSGSFSCLVSYKKQSCDCGWSMGKRIIADGTEAKITEYPFMAALKSSSGNIFCSGSIISHRCILTSADCLSLYYPEKVIVGEHDLKTTSETPYTQEHYVLQTLRHESYDARSYVNNIGIVVTTSHIDWSLGVGPICLPFLYPYATFDGVKADFAGWGTTVMGGLSSTELLKTEVTVISNAVCGSTYPFLSESQICTYTPQNDSCLLDSGGPLAWKSQRLQLIGIISVGNECGGNSHGGNTRITSQLDWIQRNTGEIYCEKL